MDGWIDGFMFSRWIHWQSIAMGWLVLWIVVSVIDGEMIRWMISKWSSIPFADQLSNSCSNPCSDAFLISGVLRFRVLCTKRISKLALARSSGRAVLALLAQWLRHSTTWNDLRQQKRHQMTNYACQRVPSSAMCQFTPLRMWHHVPST